MSVLNKVESGYLQLMRILVLALATVSLIGVALFGVVAASDHNAKPKAVSETVDIKASAFKLDNEAGQNPEEGTQNSGDDAAKRDSNAAKLQTALADVINKHGKAMLGASFHFDSANLDGAVAAVMQDEDRAEPYLSSLTKYLDDVLSRPDVAKRIKTEQAYFQVFNKAVTDYRKAYAAEKERIAREKAEASAEASERRASASLSLYLIGGLFSAFIMLVMLIVQIRIERSIRVMSEANVRA
ncbi:hypothetical protein LMG19087_01880 [Ralstonia wenshanensis]|uniref:hypothetical protein n=1 Tax=Ralstonia wenshanensis TaxID=2842456 RepID=UPI0028F4F6C2|nr:hypothetical protein [Ralstonia wenshanensis]CAJ0813782.1 hypothetical protein LMG19087_01880 [Ralstonia wenshanensis]